jgi:basic membrane protein A and related proteins
VDGSLQIFAGPLKDNTGAEKVAEGAVMSDDEVKGINWLVEGVQGTLPSA